MKVLLNLSNWAYKDFLRFLDFVKRGDQKNAFESVRKIIVDWEYEADLQDPNCMENLDVEQGGEIIAAVYSTIEDFTKSNTLKNYKVNLKLWKNSDLYIFQDAQATGNATVLEELAKRVVTFENSEKPLNAVDGILCMRAINDAYGKVISGKN